MKELGNVVRVSHAFMAPGTDGLQAMFYQKGWNGLTKSLLEFIQDALDRGCFEPKLCEAFL